MIDWLKKLGYNLISGKKIRYSRILITGTGKTGTTALFHAILNSLPQETVRSFEPESSNKTLPEDIKPPVLVKSFIPYSENFNFFEKKILLTRDPRDQLISSLLYKPYNILIKSKPGDLEKTMFTINSFLDLIRRKEASPLEIPVKLLFDIVDVGTNQRLSNVINYSISHRDVFILQYEDFTDNNLKGLSDFLEIDIRGSVEVPAKYERVTRTKSYGNWKSWFTPSDVEYFRPMMMGYMERFGYKDDWEPDNNPSLNPEMGSMYVERIIREALELRKKQNI